MKLSVSLSESDVEALDRYVDREGLHSRSAGVQRAIQLLRGQELSEEYAAAWDEWEATGEASLWDSTISDGFSPPDPADTPGENGRRDAAG